MRRLSWRSVPMTNRPPACQHLLLVDLDLRLDRFDALVALRALRQVGEFDRDPHLEIAAELDVGAAARHVGGDGDAAGNTRLRHDRRFLLMVARVQHIVRNALGLQHLGEQFGLLDRRGADEHRLAAPACLVDGFDDGVVFLLGRAVDLVVLVQARHGHVGRNVEDVEAVDVHELLGLGGRRAGHAGELAIEAEIVLEGDRGERHVLRLDRHLFLGLQRLVQALGIAPARHHAAGEFVDDDDLAVLDDVVLVALEQLVGAQRLLHVVHDGHVLGVIEIGAAQHAGFAQHLLQMLVALFGQRHRALLLVEVEVFRLERRDELVDRVVEIRFVVDGA